jgi:NAD(P)H dehydrogenase (quinone)
MEERLATDKAGFTPALEAEIAKLEACDLLIFTFPLWWFALPAILKGWVDRVFAMRRIYGDGKLYENGLGKAKKRAMIIMTSGGGPEAYGGYGVQPPLATIMTPIEHGVFWFNGFLPLDPFVAFGAARISQEERVAYLDKLDQRLRHIEEEEPRRLPPMSNFAGGGLDQKKRFMVTGIPLDMGDERLQSLLPAERQRVAELRREGILLSIFVAAPGTPDWRVFVLFREASAENVRRHLDALPMGAIFDFQITALMQTQ